jgi:hypothetical protein
MGVGVVIRMFGIGGIGGAMGTRETSAFETAAPAASVTLTFTVACACALACAAKSAASNAMAQQFHRAFLKIMRSPLVSKEGNPTRITPREEANKRSRSADLKSF